MKKNFILVSLVAALGIFSSFSALSYDGIIKFRGTILENGCTINSGRDQEVNFGKIPKEKIIGGVGTVVSSRSFTINLTNCPGSDIGIEFAGKTDTNDTTLYNSGVNGIGILLAKDDGAKINANTSVNGYSISSKNVNIPLIAKLQLTNATVNHGDINSDVKFTLIYP